MEPIPPLKTDPKYGYYPWWPEDGDGWLHPEDVELARSMIPSERVFRRDGTQGPFVVLYYGSVRLRVKSTIWQTVEWEGFDIGDWVEVLPRGQLNEPRTGVIVEMNWRKDDGGLRYQIVEGEVRIPNWYSAEDLVRVEKVGDA